MSNYSKIGKNVGLGLLILLVLVLTTVSALAAVEISETQVKFSADYNEFDDEDQSVIKENFDVSISNTESNSVTLNLEITGLPSRYNVAAINPVTIPAGETRLVNVEIDVPHLQSSGEKTIGTIVIKDSTTNVQYDSKSLVQDTKAMLTINELVVDYLSVDGDSETDTFGGNDKILKLDEDVRPGSEVTITIKEIENLFDKDYDDRESDIGDIVVKIEVDDDNLFEDNFEEEYDLDDLEAEDKDDFEVTFTIDDEADDKKYTFDIEIEGEDGKGAKHTITRELSLKVDRSKDDVRVSRFEILPENPQMCETNFVVDVTVKNFGSRDQNNVAIQLFSGSLGIIQNLPNIELDKFSRDDNSFTKTFTFDLNKKNVEIGRHEMDINVFINNDDKQDTRRAIINVGECEEEAVVVEDQNIEETITTTTVENNIRNDNETNIVASGEIVKTVEDPYTSEDVLVSIIFVCMILLLAVIAIFTAILIKK
jgi:hypothetical protein